MPRMPCVISMASPFSEPESPSSGPRVPGEPIPTLASDAARRDTGRATARTPLPSVVVAAVNAAMTATVAVTATAVAPARPRGGTAARARGRPRPPATGRGRPPPGETEAIAIATGTRGEEATTRGRGLAPGRPSGRAGARAPLRPRPRSRGRRGRPRRRPPVRGLHRPPDRPLGRPLGRLLTPTLAVMAPMPRPTTKRVCLLHDGATRKQQIINVQEPQTT